MIEVLMRIYREYAPAEYFWIRKTSAGRKERQVKFLLFTPFLLLMSASHFLWERTFGRIMYDGKRADKKIMNMN